MFVLHVIKYFILICTFSILQAGDQYPEADENTGLTAKIESPQTDKKKDKKKEKKTKKESPRKQPARSGRMVLARVLLLDGRDLEVEIDVSMMS